jgi:predicted enzyme related to lactoylglutathione lyase
MGQPVVHFEVIGKDGATLQRYYSQLFGWEVDADNPNSYGAVSREGNTNADGAGIAGGIAAFPDYAGHVTFYVEVPDVEASLATAESLAAHASSVRTWCPEPTSSSGSSPIRRDTSSGSSGPRPDDVPARRLSERACDRRGARGGRELHIAWPLAPHVRRTVGSRRACWSHGSTSTARPGRSS